MLKTGVNFKHLYQSEAEIIDAVLTFDDNPEMGYTGTDIDTCVFTWCNGNPHNLTREILKEKQIELKNKEPMRFLRKIRSLKLAETDWWASSDLVMSGDRQIYRQQLRDLPASANPVLSEDGQLTGVEWPVNPK